MRFKWRKAYTNSMLAILFLLAVWYVKTHVEITTLGHEKELTVVAQASSPIQMEPGLAELPDEKNFQQLSETSSLVLMADAATGHFKVKDKRNGHVYHSYPNPEQWEEELQAGSWRQHLRSPLMLEYKDFGKPNSRSILTSFIAQSGGIDEFRKIDGGFSLNFNLPAIGISVPVRVTLKDDYVQTEIVDKDLIEEQPMLIWLRLYPFFGAQHTVAGHDGYMLIPDGSGALIDFKEREFATNQIYNQQVYSDDIAFSVNSDYINMKDVNMPVFGLKANDKGFVAVIDEGAPYSHILASPAGAYSNYNWVAVQQNYRDTFMMIPDKNRPDRSFATYNIDNRFTGDRAVRYYLLNSGDNGYVAMAAKYREYLMDTLGLTKLKAKKEIPLDLSIIGAGTKSGFINYETVKETTTSQAMQILQRLYGLGVSNMSVSYWGWQNGGYSAYGGNFPVDDWVGGNEGMTDFVNFAHSLDIPVYLNIGYDINTTDDDGFYARKHGMRDLSGTLLKFYDYVLVSNKFAEKVLERDLPKYKELGIDGLELQGMGKYLNSDYNSEYGSDRIEALQDQQRMMKEIKDTLGSVRGERSNAYALTSVDHISYLTVDYSYNIFSSQSVPFMQIVLHGLVQYTSDFINSHERYEQDILKDIEYGYNPAFILTWEDNKLKYSYDLDEFYSTKFLGWESEIVKQYQRFNKALGSVQDQFIMDHKQLAAEVYQTVYENGVTIIVNYSDVVYTAGQINVPARDFVVLKGGDLK